MTPWGRFGVALHTDSAELVVAAMPLGHLRNPVTDAVALGPLAVLADFAAGLVNYHRRSTGEWTVTGELNLEFTPDAHAVVAGNPDIPAIATAVPIGGRAATSLSECRITYGDNVIGTATVRSVHFTPDGELSHDLDLHSRDEEPRDLATIMSLSVIAAADGPPLLRQDPHPEINNPLGVVHGGVAATGLELASSALLHTTGGANLRTATMQVTYRYPFLAGAESHYTARPVRLGRSSGSTDSTAIGADARPAITARITAYR
ncbi:hypothetical protein A5699_16080 [Mycobacterium sp. E802]|uniref:PaaI family thioesterase n=1 Tax=Mycobacterium sp. E802 TaxID=1834152 RepID=UPI0007FDEE1D|nr:PaaI family thioesterase [Mycobacterium sp. E802]OBG88798.1 hypothetical protein A5699_16080 [Mycobacterium sp. E802]